MLRFLRQLALFGKPVLDAFWTRIVGSGSEAKIAKLARQIAQQASRLRYCLQRIEGSRLLSAAVSGMNCAMPSAPAELITPGLKPLS